MRTAFDISISQHFKKSHWIDCSTKTCQGDASEKTNLVMLGCGHFIHRHCIEQDAPRSRRTYQRIICPLSCESKELIDVFPSEVKELREKFSNVSSHVEFLGKVAEAKDEGKIRDGVLEALKDTLGALYGATAEYDDLDDSVSYCWLNGCFFTAVMIAVVLGVAQGLFQSVENI